MKLKKAIVIVTADPCVNGRAAEAIRIAAGTGGWDKVQVTVCLVGKAQKVLAETVDDLEGGDIIESYLPIIAEEKNRLFLLAEEVKDSGERKTSYQRVAEITAAELAQYCRAADMVLRF